jgi:hypothetical protein
VAEQALLAVVVRQEAGLVQAVALLQAAAGLVQAVALLQAAAGLPREAEPGAPG